MSDLRAYNEERFENTFLREEAEALENAGFIHSSQGDLIEKKLPAYQRHQNFLARIGIFILACLVYSSTCGLISFLMLTGGNNYRGMFFMYMLVGFTGLEILIRRMKFFGNGADDAFLIGAQMATLCFVGNVLLDKQDENWWPLFLTAFLLGGICCMRYVDRFSALLSCLGVTALVADVLIEAGDTGKSLLPFALLFLAVGIYFLVQNLRRSANDKGYYTKSLNVCFGFSLVLFYVATNYFVVRKANEILMSNSLAPGEDISMAYVFYAFTLLTPPVYIYVAIRKKNRMLFWIGLIALACTIATIRYYHAVMPIETALIVGGCLVFLVAYLSMKKLKERAEGLTFEKDKFQSSEELLNAEALILIQNFSPKVVESTGNNGVEFGSGEFGGGGSGDTY